MTDEKIPSELDVFNSEKKETTACENCHQPSPLEHSFCPKCGQKLNDKLSVGILFRNTISNYFSVNEGIMNSLFPLIFKPGFLAIQFINGKRIKYLHPAQFYLSVSVFFFFLFSFKMKEEQTKTDLELNSKFEKRDSLNNLEKKVTDSVAYSNNKIQINDDDNNKKLDSLIAAKAPEEEMLKAMGLTDKDNRLTKLLYTKALKFYKKRGSGILEAFANNIPISFFFLMPLFALFLKLFYYRKGNYVNHLVFTFYFFTFLFVTFTAILALSYLIEIPNWLVFGLICAVNVHLIIGIMRFYKEKPLRTFLKTSALLSIFAIFIIPITVALIALISLILY